MKQKSQQQEQQSPKEPIQEEGKRRSMATSFISRLLNMFNSVMQWWRRKHACTDREEKQALVKEREKTRKLKSPLRIASKAEGRKQEVRGSPSQGNTPEGRPQAVEEPKRKMLHAPQSHLYIIDTRYIGYGEHGLLKIIAEISDSASKIIVLRGIIDPTKEELMAISQFDKRLNIEIVKPPNKKLIQRKIDSLVTKNLELFSIVTVLKSLDMRESKTYKKGKRKSTQGSIKKKQSKVKRIEIPSWEEIIEMRGIQSPKENLIVWDIENISYRNIDRVLQKAHKEGDIAMVSVEPFSDNMTKTLFPYILLYGIKIYTGHEDSDKKIVEIIEEKHKGYGAVTIVTNDTDFVPTIKKVLAEGSVVQVLLNAIQNKSMLMQLKLDHERLRVQVL